MYVPRSASYQSKRSCDTQANQTAKGVVASRDALVGLLESIGHFVGRLKIYTEIPLSSAMIEIVVQIMVELISLLAMETEKFTRRRLGESDLIDDYWRGISLTATQSNL